MQVQKFKLFNRTTGFADKALSLKELLTRGHELLYEYDEFLQFLGYHDSDGKEVYEGDVLILNITEDLMNHEISSFYNSNLGRIIEREGDITNVILVNNPNKQFMSMDYTIYFCRNGRIARDEDGDFQVVCLGDDKAFPQYLCNKGAIVLGNIIEDKNFLSYF